MNIRVGFWLAVAVALSGCVTSPTGRSQFLLVSPDAAIAESRVAYLATVRQLQREDKLLNDPLLAERVGEVTGRVVAATVARYPHTAGWNWSVALIDGPETVNAWCMAGGRMAVYSGLVHQLDLTDDELAQIMGHEIAHAVANHTAERMSMAIASGLGLAAVAATATIRGRCRVLPWRQPWPSIFRTAGWASPKPIEWALNLRRGPATSRVPRSLFGARWGP